MNRPAEQFDLFNQVIEETARELTRIEQSAKHQADGKQWEEATYYVGQHAKLKAARPRATTHAINREIRRVPGYAGPKPTFLSNALAVRRVFPEIFSSGTKKFGYQIYRQIAVSRVPDKAALLAWFEALPDEDQRRETLREEIRNRVDAPLHSSIIKPSDNWNFAKVKYGRIDEDSHGYIPGDIYANCLWYYSRPGDTVYEPMAAAGQIWRVWEDRDEWMRPEQWDLNIITSDLTPRGPYRNRIAPCDITRESVVDRADYIIMDVPYLEMVIGAYSDKERDLANQPLAQWLASIQAIGGVCAGIQPAGGRLTLICPNYLDWKTGRRILITDQVRQLIKQAGYVLIDLAYSTRRIQQEQTPDMARNNRNAKAIRAMLSDMAEVATFERTGAG